MGGADTLCNLTLNGFFGLDSVSSGLCKPFSDERDGINIGEAAAFMLLSLERPDAPEAIALLGAGDSSDAHHISAPHPEGLGAEVAMRNALADAGLAAADIAYVNAHGTSTPLNDAMESKAIFRVLGENVPVSSTKPLTGHTLAPQAPLKPPFAGTSSATAFHCQSPSTSSHGILRLPQSAWQHAGSH